MKKTLIITYYWPPKGGVGVQRWLKLTKYLYRNNLEPIIYTPDNGISPLNDISLLNEVPSNLKIIKKKIFEPQMLLNLFTKRSVSSDFLIRKSSNFLDLCFQWVRANIFIPDSRCFWIKPSIRFLDNYITENKIDIVISTGPPHSMHMIGLALKKKHNIKWIADFRDPWTEIEYFDNLPLLPIVLNKHKKLEKDVFLTADLIISVSNFWADRFRMSGAKNVFVLTNGYDSEDYEESNPKTPCSEFQIGHFGLYNKLRDYSFFWNTIIKLNNNLVGFESNLKLFFAGEVHADFFNNLKSKNLFQKLDYYDYLDHKDAIKNMMKCDLLLVTQGDTKLALGRLPAKVFEYLRSRRPILAIGKKNSDLEKLISNISYAWFVDFDNEHLLYQTIIEIYNLRISPKSFRDDISLFSRENQAKELINIINNL